MATKTTNATAKSRVVYYLDYRDGYMQGPYEKEDTAREFLEVLAEDEGYLTSQSDNAPLLVKAEFSFVDPDKVPTDYRIVLPGEA
jgi:hypothetical protein